MHRDEWTYLFWMDLELMQDTMVLKFPPMEEYMNILWLSQRNLTYQDIGAFPRFEG